MPHRNVLSLVRSIAAALGATALTYALPGQADTTEASPRLSLTLASLASPAADGALEELTVHEIPSVPQLASTIDLTAKTDNLWDRIRHGFAMTNLNDDLVLYYQQRYQSRPDGLRRMIERARPYLHFIVEELEARGMPTELALLPMVESAFNPNAYSPAHASGLWQFIPATGKRFDLEQTWWRDERRDIVASTGAALDYLQAIYEMHGDWHLALASYNWGEGAVKRAINKNESRGLPTDYPNLTMPNETRHYVPKLQALKNILGNPALFAQLDLPAIANEAYFATLETRRPIDVKTAARLANMSTEEFKRLNPSHNRPIIGPDTPVVVPADKLDAFRHNLANTAAPLTQWQVYTLKSTERLSQVAARFDTTTSELASANGLSTNVRLRAGSELLVPGNGITKGLTNLLNDPSPQQLIAVERASRSCVKSGKGAKKSGAACAKGKSRVAAKKGKARGKRAKSSGRSGKKSRSVKSRRNKPVAAGRHTRRG